MMSNPALEPNVATGVHLGAVSQKSENVTMLRAIHRTTESNARQIREHGFALEKFGCGAGLGMLEEPAGIFVSRYGGQDFVEELSNRDLTMDAVCEVEFPCRALWEPTREERIAFSKTTQIEWMMDFFPGLSAEQAEAVRKVSARDMDRLAVPAHVWNFALGDEGEILFKKFFAKKLIERGYDAVEWVEPVHRIKQTLVLDPGSIRVLRWENEPAPLSLGPTFENTLTPEMESTHVAGR